MFYSKIGVAKFNGGDAISAAVFFSTVRLIAAKTLRREPQTVGKRKIKETPIDRTATVKAAKFRATIGLGMSPQLPTF